MTGELFINGKDAWAVWGVNMGDRFIDALDAPLEMKAYIENESRLEHGKRVMTVDAKVASRDITLGFTIIGKSENDYRTKRNAFFMELQKGMFTVEVPVLGANVYHLLYTGKNITYGMNLSRNFSHFSMKVTELNPMART